jgi:polysaccharide pyruvyl transferase WcaK-like protein
MFRKLVMTKITYIGWLGYQNIGDEAFLPANMKLFPDCWLVPNNRRFESKITLFGGGTLFPRWPVWIMKNKYNYAIGIGMRSPGFWGPPKPWQIEILRGYDFRFMGVRGPHSQELLASYGIESIVTGDTALILEPNSYEATEKGLVGINIAKIRGAKHVKGSDIWGSDEEQLLDVMMRVCGKLEALGYRLLLLPFDPDDTIYLQKIAAALHNVELLGDMSDPIQVMNAVSRCEFLIGEKLHSIVFSACCYVPFISLEYRPKCRDFTALLGLEDFTVRTDEVSAERVLDLFGELSRNRPRYSDDLRLKVNRQREVLRQSSQNIQDEWNQLDTSWSTVGKKVQMVRQKLLKEKIKISSHIGRLGRNPSY